MGSTHSLGADCAPKLCVIYTRFSPRRNAAECESCEVQGAYCRQYAHEKGWEIRAQLDDPDRSGADGAREALWRAIGTLKKGDILLVYKRDRLARDNYLSAYIDLRVHEKGCTIVAVDGDISGEGPIQELVRTVVAAIATFERHQIAKRTSDAMLSHQRRGRRMSRRCPYGWSADPTDSARMIPNEKERAAVREIWRLSQAGYGPRPIARMIDPGACRAAGGWKCGHITAILRRLNQMHGELFDEPPPA